MGLAGSPESRRRKRNWLWRRQADRPSGPRLCLLCGLQIMQKSEATFEHLLPASQNGGDGLDNLALSHRACNEARGKRPLTSAQWGRHQRWFGSHTLKSFAVASR